MEIWYQIRLSGIYINIKAMRPSFPWNIYGADSLHLRESIIIQFTWA